MNDDARHAAWVRAGENSEEALLDTLRRAHHAEVFRTLARDVEGVLTVEQVADDLSALADTMLALTARWCWQRLKNRHRNHETPRGRTDDQRNFSAHPGRGEPRHRARPPAQARAADRHPGAGHRGAVARPSRGGGNGWRHSPAWAA